MEKFCTYLHPIEVIQEQVYFLHIICMFYNIKPSYSSEKRHTLWQSSVRKWSGQKYYRPLKYIFEPVILEGVQTSYRISESVQWLGAINKG